MDARPAIWEGGVSKGSGEEAGAGAGAGDEVWMRRLERRGVWDEFELELPNGVDWDWLPVPPDGKGKRKRKRKRNL